MSDDKENNRTLLGEHPLLADGDLVAEGGRCTVQMTFRFERYVAKGSSSADMFVILGTSIQVDAKRFAIPESSQKAAAVAHSVGGDVITKGPFYGRTAIPAFTALL